MNSDRGFVGGRREVLQGLLCAGVVVAMGDWSRVLAAATPAPAPAPQVPVEGFSPAGISLGVTRVEKVVMTDGQWQAKLAPESFAITRHEGTEIAYTGKTWNLHADGLYRCVCCATALFDSRTKFESGTGWPSFWQPISKHNVREISDNTLEMGRTAVSCARCDAHLGHVFDDGPRPTGLRYCMNSGAMVFVARAV